MLDCLCVITPRCLSVVCGAFEDCDPLQEHSQTTEAQLAEASTQLHELKLRQRELEARNIWLERTASSSRQGLLQPQTLQATVQVWQVYAYRLSHHNRLLLLLWLMPKN